MPFSIMTPRIITLSIMSLGIMYLGIMSLGIMSLSILPLSILPLSIMTLSVMTLSTKLSDIHHNNTKLNTIRHIGTELKQYKMRHSGSNVVIPLWGKWSGTENYFVSQQNGLFWRRGTMTAVMNNQNQIESVTTSAYARISKPVPKSSVWRTIRNCYPE
jgi:hypothetical protein